MMQTRLPSRTAIRDNLIVTRSGSGWLVSCLPKDLPDTTADSLPDRCFREKHVSGDSLAVMTKNVERGSTIMLTVGPAEDDTGEADATDGFPCWIQTEEARTILTYASRFAAPAGRTVFVLYAGDDGMTLWDAAGGRRRFCPVGLSLIDRMILRANMSPREWGGHSEGFQPDPDADRSSLLAQCAVLRRLYFDAEREGISDQAITVSVPGGTLGVSMEMMIALLEEPNPWILSEHLDGKDLALLTPAQRGMSWAAAAGAFLRQAASEFSGRDGSPVLILAGDAVRMEQLKALAADCFQGFHVIPDPSGTHPVHAGLCRMAAELTENAFRREIVLRLCEWLKGQDACSSFGPLLAQAYQGALSGMMDLFQTIWKNELKQWASKTVDSTYDCILPAGLRYKNEVEPKGPALVQQEVLKTLDTFCSWALDRIGKETGCTPDTVHAVYSIVCSVISGIKEKLQVCDQAAIGLSRFVYLRMVLYNRTVIGSNYPEEPFSLFSNRRPESREYISAVKPENLKIMKENDLDAWVATIDLDAQASDSSFLLTDLSRRIESRINQ